jgi:ferrochelatase
MSVQAYGDRVQAALAADGGGEPRFTLVRSWATEPGYVSYLATAVGDALTRLGSAAAGAEVVFTAHSLPERILATGDPYPDELRATAEAVARAAGLERWSIAWQSAGRTNEPWIGPDVLEVLPRLVEAGATGAVVCPAGFVADHLEVLYDLDVEAAAEARTLGLPFARTAAPNADQALAATLAGVVAARLPSGICLQ